MYEPFYLGTGKRPYARVQTVLDPQVPGPQYHSLIQRRREIIPFNVQFRQDSLLKQNST